MVVNLSTFTYSACHLNECLKKFYAGLGRKKAKSISPAVIWQPGNIQRHLTALGRPFNLRTDETFNSSNQLLDAVLKVNKANGKTKPVQHKDSLSEADKVRLQEYFADVLQTEDSYKLQSYC